ncbi:MAG: hypothetical protein U0457_06455 [Candidatus Sericytochromatia bacterium]
MKNNNLQKEILFIENFDQNNISVVFLFPIGRAGSVLFQSLIDSHKDVLMIPKIFPIYRGLETILNKTSDIYEITDYILDVLLDEDHGENFYLGKNKDYDFSLPKKEIREYFIYIINTLKQINKKNIILAFHVAYAKIKNIDLSKIKCIFIHEHFIKRVEYYDKFSIKDIENVFNLLFFSENYLFNNINNDFPNAKLIFTVRGFVSTFLSYYNATKNYNKYIDFYVFIKNLYFSNILYNEIDLNIQNNILKTNKYIIIDFFELNKNLEKTMEKVSLFINIDYSESLLKSTFNNNLWWYGDKQGVNPNAKDEAYKNIETDFEALNYVMIKNQGSFYQNNILHLDNVSLKNIEENNDYLKNINNIIKNRILPFSELELFSFIIKITESLYYDNFDIFLDFLPNFRNNTIFFSKDRTFIFDNTIYFKKLKIIIQSNYYNKYDNEDAYFIQIFSKTDFTFDLNYIKDLNYKTDQIWVNSSFTKKILEKNGIVSEKIKEVTPFLEPFFKEKIKDKDYTLPSFYNKKINFICEFEEKNDINSIIDIFNNLSLYYDNFNLNFIIFEPENNIKFLEEKINNSTIKNINIISYNKPISINLFDNMHYQIYISKSNFSSNNLLNAFCMGVIPISTGLGSSYNFFDKNNSVLIDYKIVDNTIFFDKNNLKDTLENILIDNLGNYYKNKLDNLKEFIFNLDKKFFENNILSVLGNLEDKDIFRTNYNKILEKEYNEALICYNNNDYGNSAVILLKLLKYERKYDYLYLLALIELKYENYDNLESLLYEIIDNFGTNESIEKDFYSVLN